MKAWPSGLLSSLKILKPPAATSPNPSSARGALYEATRLRDQQFVALVKGGGGNMIATRDRIFNGFNTPLLPEVLVLHLRSGRRA